MPDQLFEFYHDPMHRFIIGAATQSEALEMLDRYLKEHPRLPSLEYWHLSKILGKLDYGIFSIR